MAAEGMPFDMNEFLDMSPISGVAHLDTKHKTKNNLKEFTEAKSSEEVIEAAQE